MTPDNSGEEAFILLNGMIVKRFQPVMPSKLLRLRRRTVADAADVVDDESDDAEDCKLLKQAASTTLTQTISRSRTKCAIIRPIIRANKRV